MHRPCTKCQDLSLLLQKLLDKVRDQLHESCELEEKARELLSEARSHERRAYKRVVAEAERVRILESMRLAGTWVQPTTPAGFVGFMRAVY
jgi:hypothetical protein